MYDTRRMDYQYYNILNILPRAIYDTGPFLSIHVNNFADNRPDFFLHARRWDNDLNDVCARILFLRVNCQKWGDLFGLTSIQKQHNK